MKNKILKTTKGVVLPKLPRMWTILFDELLFEVFRTYYKPIGFTAKYLEITTDELEDWRRFIKELLSSMPSARNSEENESPS